MTWTKGNNKGEWSLQSWGITSDGEHADILEIEKHGSEDGHEYDEYVLHLDNSHDARLIELSPRMAEALICIINDLYNSGESVIDEYKDLFEELMKLQKAD